MRVQARRPERRRRPAWLPTVVGLLVLLAGFSACGGPAPSPTLPPTPTPRPTPTPDPHLTDPATVQEIYSTLRARGVQVIATTALKGDEPRIVITATLANWPLVLSEFSSAPVRAERAPIQNGTAPGERQAPYAFAGLNVVVEFGPKGTGAPATPDPTHLEVARTLAAELDRLVGPLVERSSARVSPVATPRPSSPRPSPTASPAG